MPRGAYFLTDAGMGKDIADFPHADHRAAGGNKFFQDGRVGWFDGVVVTVAGALEIRGAGELLGAEQSGQINQVGFSLYSDMLARAVEALRKGEEPDLEDPVHRGIEIELHVPALIPESYLADVQARLTLYKRIASAKSTESLRELQVEMIDRFGLLPESIKALFEIAELRLIAERIGIIKLDFGPQGGRVEFTEQTRADPAALIRLIQERSLDYRMEGPQKLRILMQEEDEAIRFGETQDLLQRLETG